MTNHLDHYFPFPIYAETRSISTELSQLVSNPSVHSTRSALLKPILQDGPGCPINAKNVLRREKQSSRREAKKPGIKQGRLIRTSRITASQTERSLSVADNHRALLFVAPLPPPHTLSFTTASCKKELNSLSLF